MSHTNSRKLFRNLLTYLVGAQQPRKKDHITSKKIKNTTLVKDSKKIKVEKDQVKDSKTEDQIV